MKDPAEEWTELQAEIARLREVLEMLLNATQPTFDGTPEWAEAEDALKETND